MEVTDGSSDSEEYDQQELEVALYSQIHFDTSIDSETHYQRVSRPLKIGVKELPIRILPAPKKPLFCGDFIAFSSNVCEDDEDKTEPHSAVSLPKKHKTVVNVPVVIKSRNDKFKEGDVINLEVVTPPKNNRLKSSANLNNKTAYHACSPESTPATSILEKLQLTEKLPDHVKGLKKNDVGFVNDGFVNINEIKSDKSKTLAKGGNLTAALKVKNKLKSEKHLEEKELLLPFSVTKTPLKPKVTERKNVAPEEVVIQASSESVKKSKESKPSKNSLAKLESFLQLSKSETDSSVLKSKKRASLNKTDTAVKQRKPAVLLRRPPAIAVRYQQDSDTNTDYSDSEGSSITSPVKTQQSTLKDSSLNSASSDNLAKRHPGTKSGEERSESQVPPDQQAVSDYKTVKNEQENITACSVIEIMSSEEEDETDEEEHDEKYDAPGKVEGTQNDKVEEVEDKNGDIDEEVEDVINETDEETEDSSVEEASTSSSEDTDSSDPEDFLTESIPGLEFNLDRGINEFSFGKSDGDNWKIDEKDRFNIPSTLSRYFIPHVIQCRNCKADGHLSRDCSQPLKRRCIFCAEEGHSYQACPSAVCFNCNAPGHKLSDCKERKQKWYVACTRCWMPGHDEEKCPDRWRQYHITINTKGSNLVTAPKHAKNPLIFCYNCGKKGHLGHECKLPRMNKFVAANYPFIACYDTKNKRKEMRQSRRDIKDSRKTEPNHKDKKLVKLDSSFGKSKVHDRVGQRQLSKDQRKRQIHGQGVERGGGEDASEYYRKQYTHERDEQDDHVRRKRRRSNQRRKWEDSTNVNDEGRYEGNSASGQGRKGTTFGRDYKLSYMDQEREYGGRDVMDDDFLNDFESHQVNNNEWWENHDKPARKRRKKNKESFSSNNDNDWKRAGQDRREELFGNTIASQGSQIYGMRDTAQNRGGEWRKNKQQQRVQGKQNQDFSPELCRGRKIDHFYGSSINISDRELQGGNLSNSMQRHGQRSSGNTNFRQAPLHHSASWPVLQKAGSNLLLNKNGFKAQNERFVAMKRHCDITVSLRK